MQRSPARFALRPPDIRHCEKQVLYDQGIALPAGDVKGVPAVFVSQCRVCAVAQQLLDHGKVSPSAGHHQRSPEQEEQVKSSKVGCHIKSYHTVRFFKYSKYMR